MGRVRRAVSASIYLRNEETGAYFRKPLRFRALVDQAYTIATDRLFAYETT